MRIAEVASKVRPVRSDRVYLAPDVSKSSGLKHNPFAKLGKDQT